MFATPHQELLEASHLFASPDDHRLSFASASSSGSPPHQPQHGSSSSSTGAVRRPPRKSTLTQQQKNQKRQRATQDQLVTLEYEFNKNPTPTAVVRDRIAQEINMTERSVQIWFQNRRAKIKLLAKKSLENGEDVESIPESVRLYLAHQNPDMKALAYGMTGGLNGYGAGYPNGEQSGSGKIFIHHFTCRSLNIGSWRRIGQNAMDLVVFYSPEKACITYYINNDSAGYKIEYPFRKIKSIELETLNVPMAPPNNPGVQQAQLVIQLLSPPHFFMDTSGSGGFVQCGDFTEDQQATQILTHTLGGNAKSLQQQLSKLLNLDVYQNRHRPQQTPFMFDATFAAPPSPPLRPSSASGMMAPPSLVQQEARGNHVINPYRHKRQRSRSVPNINEFPHFGPMPSFQFDDVIIEPENEDFFLANSVSPKLKMEDGSPASVNHLFAPAPQHPHAVSNNLRIDTSAPGFLDYRPTYPLSAATTASVSEYAASPGFPGQIPNELAMTPGLHSPFIDQPWLSPMMNPNGLVPQSVSPLSALSNGDPIIASGSPPFIDRTGSADLFPLTHEQALYANDDLTELYAKQSLTIHQQTPPALEDIEDVEQHLTPYNLSPMGQPMTLSPE